MEVQRLPVQIATANATAISVERVFRLKAVTNFNIACMIISLIGLLVALAYTGQHAERLFAFMLITFSLFFLSTSLVTMVKLAIVYLGQESAGPYFRKVFNIQTIKTLMMLSLFAEVFGSMGMILSASELIQIRIGLFSSGASSAIYAFIFFALFMSISVIFHVCIVGYGVYTLPILQT